MGDVAGEVSMGWLVGGGDVVVVLVGGGVDAAAASPGINVSDPSWGG